MKKLPSNVFYLFILLLLAAPIIARSETEQAKALPSLFVYETNYTFDIAIPGQVIRHAFGLKNIGTATLKIVQIGVCCGAEVILSNDNLSVGETALLKVSFPLPDSLGVQSRTIVVESNDPDQPQKLLTITANVIAPVVLEPEVVSFGQLSRFDTFQKELTIRPNFQFSITNVECISAHFSASYQWDERRKAYRIKISTVPPLPAGGISALLRISTDQEVPHTITVPLVGSVIGNCFAIPSEITIPSSEHSRLAHRGVLRYRGTNGFKILDVESPSPEVRVKFRPDKNGYSFNVETLTTNLTQINGKTIVFHTENIDDQVLLPIRVLESAKVADSMIEASHHPDLVWDTDVKSVELNPGDQEVVYAFNFTNVRSSPITITNVHTSCGCTTAQLPALPWKIGAGEHGAIGVTVDTKGQVGKMVRTVTVETDNNTKQLTVTVITPDFPVSAGKSNNFNKAPSSQMVVKKVQTAASTFPPQDPDRGRSLQLARVDRQRIFQDDCSGCHVLAGEGKFGRELYGSICGVCHNSPRRAAIVPRLIFSKFPAKEGFWETWITFGKPDSLMPAFAKEEGGNLTRSQVNSLAKYLAEECSRMRASVK